MNLYKINVKYKTMNYIVNSISYLSIIEEK